MNERFQLELERWVSEPEKDILIVVDKGPLVLEEVLRHLPSKRLTCRAQWKGKTVIAKFFYGEGFKRHASKESMSLQAIENSGINTPKLLCVEDRSDASILIIDYVTESVSLLEWLKNKPEESEFVQILSAATEVMMVCHKVGFEINDPHLENFLLSNGRVYIIDAGDIEHSKNEIIATKAVENMTLFYSQLYVQWDALAYQVFSKVYVSNGGGNLLNAEEWQKLLIKHRLWKERQFIHKKVFRECSRFICNKDKRRFFIMNREDFSPELDQALLKPDDLIQSGECLKNGRTATVSRVQVGSRSYVLKRYNIKKPIHALVRGLIWSRAAVSWKNGHILRMLGIPTAKPIAMIEERWGLIRRRSYILTEDISARHSWDVFEDVSTSESEKELWAASIYDLFLQLKKAQISHGDLKALNIMCAEYGPVFIDLDGLILHRSKKRFERQYKKDILRFLISWGLGWEKKPYFDRYKKLLR